MSDSYDQLKAHYDRLKAQEIGWQPIATAPKDGTHILGFFREHGYDYWACCKWMEFDDGSRGWIGGTFKSGPDGSWTTARNITHWMPLPAPPAETP